MTQNAQNILQDQLKVVRERFIGLLDERLDELEVLRTRLDQKSEREEVLKQIQFITHKIGGTAGTLGFTETGDMAIRAENAIITNLASGGESPTLEETVEVIDAFLENAADISFRFS